MNLSRLYLGDEVKARNWQRRLVSRIRCAVRRRRSLILKRDQYQRFHLARADETDVVSLLADAAGVDWLLHMPSGEARFFEFM